MIELGSFPANTDFHYAIAWRVNPDGATYPQSPGADLYVAINTGLADTGFSWARDRNWELAYHVKPSSSTRPYILVIGNQKACAESNVTVGIAWHVWRP